MRWTCPAILWLFLLLSIPVAPQPSHSREDLSDLVLVLDPGHGDRCWGRVPADPGATVKSLYGEVAECVLTWDTALRVKELAESHGARVYLTLSMPEKPEAHPKNWDQNSIPEPGSPDSPYRTLVERPTPSSIGQALYSRVETANRIYNTWQWTHDVYFLSLHFDSTNPDLAGISFYYPDWCEKPPFVSVLERSIRRRGGERRSLRTGFEYGLSQAYPYAVLSHANNPDSYLVELANLRSLGNSGANPDLEKALNPQERQAYAELLVEALLHRPEPLHSNRRTVRRLALALLLFFALLLFRQWRKKRYRSSSRR
ncbi:MAG TPA: N-acetylmuramoyl-L-alanine amidase [Phycisphaerales bacterium]|nr:N-acetylmuramoyl-L-alanine amidase [Phycisphaerales bacterium]